GGGFSGVEVAGAITEVTNHALRFYPFSQRRASAHHLVATRPTQPFSFKNLGMLASLGNRTAVAEILGIRISGFFACILWRAIYLAKLPSLERRLEVLVDWNAA